jgi:hypothetical protein
MRPVDQTRFGGPSAPPDEWGDCFAASVASILEIPLSEVPPGLGTAEGWEVECNAWLRRFGLAVVSFEWDTRWPREWPPEAWHLLAGRSPRGDWDHSTVGRKGQVVHDPHPSRAGLVGTLRHVTLFVAMDPAAFVRKERQGIPSQGQGPPRHVNGCTFARADCAVAIRILHPLDKRARASERERVCKRNSWGVTSRRRRNAAERLPPLCSPFS